MSLVGAVKAFNKVGARLLTKETSVKLEKHVFNMGGETFSMGMKLFHGVKPPKEAVTGSFVQGETQFGQKGFSIVSFFDDSGKLIERSRFNHIQDKVELASRTQYNNKVIIGDGKGSADVSSCRKITNFFRDNKIAETEDFNAVVDYRPSNPVVTRSILTTRKGQGGVWFEQASRDKSVAGTKHLTDRYDVTIEQVGKGIAKKSYKASYDFSPNGHFYTNFTGKIQSEGLTPKQVKMLREDQYLPVRLMGKEQRLEHIKKDVFENTGIPQSTKVNYYNSPHDSRGGYEQYGDIYINLANCCSDFNVLSHESRHVWQRNLIEALKQGKIKDPQMKMFAEDLKYAFEHVPKDYHLHGESYRNCLFERDAFGWGDTYQKRFYSNEADLYHIFDLSKASYYLG